MKRHSREMLLGHSNVDSVQVAVIQMLKNVHHFIGHRARSSIDSRRSACTSGQPFTGDFERLQSTWVT
jgi:hypothetical protein